MQLSSKKLGCQHDFFHTPCTGFPSHELFLKLTALAASLGRMKIEADDSIATMESIFSATARLNKIKNIKERGKEKKVGGKDRK